MAPPRCRRQRHRFGAVVEQNPQLELVARQAGQLLQAPQVALPDGGCRLYLDANQLSGRILDHEIDLDLVGAAVVHQAIVTVRRGRVLEQLTEDEGLHCQSACSERQRSASDSQRDSA